MLAEFLLKGNHLHFICMAISRRRASPTSGHSLTIPSLQQRESFTLCNFNIVPTILHVLLQPRHWSHVRNIYELPAVEPFAPQIMIPTILPVASTTAHSESPIQVKDLLSLLRTTQCFIDVVLWLCQTTDLSLLRYPYVMLLAPPLLTIIRRGFCCESSIFDVRSSSIDTDHPRRSSFRLTRPWTDEFGE
jgi:hypothetical protein